MSVEPPIHFRCPNCSAEHSRGYLDGVSLFRCLRCGYQGATDPVCNVCGEQRSAHVSTEDGPLSHPREARGEGRYVLDRPGYTMSGCIGGFPGDDDIDMPPTFKFVPAERFADPYGHGWSPYP